MLMREGTIVDATMGMTVKRFANRLKKKVPTP